MRWAGSLQKTTLSARWAKYDLDGRSLVRQVSKKFVRSTGKVLRGFRRMELTISLVPDTDKSGYVVGSRYGQWRRRCLDTVQYRSIVSMMNVTAGTGDDIDLGCCCCYCAVVTMGITNVG
jgi:hypothetical protein